MNDAVATNVGFADRVPDYLAQVERALDRWLPDPELPPRALHQAMRYSVLGGGKRVRPLLAYAAGEALEVDSRLLDPPAVAIELMHAFSLVHDDLPAMDDDDLRRGRPTTHRAFDEATAILAADALQPLAFQVLSTDTRLSQYPEAQVRLVALLAEACGSNGMTGGQAIDIAAEGARLDPAELEHMYRLKTGRLLRASVLSATQYPPVADTAACHALELYVDSLGLAFQIRDDILDIEGSTAQIGKQRGADIARDKATYPALFGMDTARRRTEELLATGLTALEHFGPSGDGLRWLARFIVLRES